MKLSDHVQLKAIKCNLKEISIPNIYEETSIPLRYLNYRKNQRDRDGKVVLGLEIKVLVKEANKHIKKYNLRILKGRTTDFSAGILSASDELGQTLLGRRLNQLHYLPFWTGSPSRVYLSIAKPR